MHSDLLLKAAHSHKILLRSKQTGNVSNDCAKLDRPSAPQIRPRNSKTRSDARAEIQYGTVRYGHAAAQSTHHNSPIIKGPTRPCGLFRAVPRESKESVAMSIWSATIHDLSDPMNGSAIHHDPPLLADLYPTRLTARLAPPANDYTSPTSALAPSFVQANLIVLPARYAADFRLLCQRNPAPCPLLAESRSPGCWDRLTSWISGVADESLAANLDIRRDAPRYMVYRDGVLLRSQTKDIVEEWTDDHVAFLIGCSFSFDSALAQAGLPPRHVAMNRNVPMYRTNIPLCPAGVFSGATYVVSMRPYNAHEVDAARAITRPYVATHGEPIAWGWDAVDRLGIQDLNAPEWGDMPLRLDGRSMMEGDEDELPVFWACGVTPQEAVMKAGLKGTVMAHAPGHMLVLDAREGDVMQKDLMPHAAC